VDRQCWPTEIGEAWENEGETRLSSCALQQVSYMHSTHTVLLMLAKFVKATM